MADGADEPVVLQGVEEELLAAHALDEGDDSRDGLLRSGGGWHERVGPAAKEVRLRVKDALVTLAGHGMPAHKRHRGGQVTLGPAQHLDFGGRGIGDDGTVGEMRGDRVKDPFHRDGGHGHDDQRGAVHRFVERGDGAIDGAESHGGGHDGGVGVEAD